MYLFQNEWAPISCREETPTSSTTQNSCTLPPAILQPKERPDTLDTTLEEPHQSWHPSVNPVHPMSVPHMTTSYSSDHVISKATASSMRITDSGDEVAPPSTHIQISSNETTELNNNKYHRKSTSPCKPKGLTPPRQTSPGYTPYEQMYGSKFRLNTALSASTRDSPLPSLQWADSKEVRNFWLYYVLFKSNHKDNQIFNLVSLF